ncbi:MAG TPA: L-histidine N(alpha)-methyltransferase [Acetobacteraceae bacterium]|nr:L-histidine N(alpha)-methyltransferase [Acetobacteraceae bacterium]
MPDDSAVMLAAGNVADAALSGLLQPQKTLPAKLFYDEAGCRLFGRITELPEYYLTRTELALLAEVAPHVAAMVHGPAVLVEYGASDETKAEFLLRESERAQVFQAYVPIDVAVPQLEQMRNRLRRRRPDLLVCLVPADFMEVAALPTQVPSLPRLGFFPGSTIGNLDPQEARRFLQAARGALGDQSRFLVGVDLRKDPAILLPAYDDAQGVTAAFNRNLLVRLNREAGADFDLSAFAHRAEWNDELSRIEMHLVSLRDQVVRVAGHAISFASGETIHTENSYKYAPERFAALAEQAGWHSAELWTDPARLFSLHLLEPQRGP